MRGRAALVAAIGALITQAACGSERAESTTENRAAAELPAHVVPDDYTGRFRGTAVTVLSSDEHGPQLCSYILESDPPQCEGPEVVGWDWNAVEHESSHDTKWGDYQVDGTFTDDTFTLTEPATPPSPPPPENSAPVSACAEPEGGWPIPDPSKTTLEDQERAFSTINRSEGFSDGWVGWLIPADEITETSSNNPENFIINVLTTGDVTATEAAIREVWGGKLCVAPAEHAHTARELNQIADEISGTHGVESVASDTRAGNVEVGAWVATEQLWRQLTDEYGAEVIDLQGLLEPID